MIGTGKDALAVVRSMESDHPIDQVQVQPNGLDCRLWSVGRMSPECFRLTVDRSLIQMPAPIPVDPTWVKVDGDMRPDFFELSPGAYAIEMVEHISVPVGFCALVVGRSTLNRPGILIRSSWYDTGFEGRIGGTMYVHRPVQLEKLARVAQVILFGAAHTELYRGSYGDNAS